MANNFIRYPSVIGNIPTYSTFSALPTNMLDGSVAITLDTYDLYTYEILSATWVIIGGPGATLSIGTIDSQTKSANGAVIASDALIMQTADGTNPGLVSATAQTLAGAKTFSTAPILSSLTASKALILDGSKNITTLSYGMAPAASTLAEWDANSNLSANNHIEGYTTQATAASTTILTVASSYQQFFTGSTTQTVTLPVTSTLVLGQQFSIVNNSSGVVTVQSSGANTLQAMGSMTQLLVTVISTSGTGTASWSWTYIAETAGTVTSVAMTVPASSLFSVAGSPITTSGTLAVTTAGTSGGIPYFSSTTQMNSSALLAQYGVLLGGGPGAAPSSLSPNASTAFPLVSGGTGANPSWALLTVAGGGTGSATVVSAPAATAWAGWDANKNLSANNHIEGYRTTATAATTTTLVVGDAFQQYFTGSTTQTVVLPVTSTLVLGMQYQVINLSSGVVTVQSSGNNTLQAMAANTQLIATVILTSGTNTASWSWSYGTNTAAVGTVTSVALSVPAASILGVSGSPVTTSGTLGITTTGTSGGIPYFSSTSQLTSSALLTANQLILGGGAGATPVSLAAGSQYQVLRMGASNPAYGSINLDQSAAVTGVLPNGNTTATNANTASTIVARDGSGNFTAGTITAALTGTASGNTTYSANNHGTVFSGSANAMTVLAPDSSTTKVLTSGGTGADPSWAAVAGTSFATQTANTFLTGPASGSAATPTFRALAASDYAVANISNGFTSNLGFSTSVGSSALTINLKQNDGSTDATASAPVVVGFRNATAATGSYSLVQTTGSLSIVVASGASLGQTSAVNQYVWVYALNNAGTIELAVSGVKLFDDYSIQSSTTIGAGSTSGTVLYSTTGRSNVPIRLIGRLLVNESTAGTWASNATEIAIVTGKQPVTTTDWTSYTQTINGASGNPAKGTTSVDNAQYRRVGGQMEIIYNIVTTGAGTAGTGAYKFLIPGSFSIDTTIQPVSTGNSKNRVGFCVVDSGGGAVEEGPVFAYDSTDLALATLSALNVLTTVSSTAFALSNSGVIYTFRAWVPISGWSTYGP